MKHSVCVLIAIAALSGVALAQNDTVRVLVWDNDAGEPAQRNPAVCMDTLDRCYYVWGDYRLLSWDIYGQRYDASAPGYDSVNFLVNSSPNDGRIRRYPDVACDTAGWFVAVWEEYSSSLGYNISFRRFAPNGLPLGAQVMASKSAASVAKGLAKIARDKHSGYFVIVWQEKLGALYNIYARAYNRSGAAITDTMMINDATSIAWHPDVAMNDTLVVVTWADNRGGDYDIYARNYNITTGAMSPRGASYQVNGDATARKQDYPSIAMPCSLATGANRYWVIAWEDSRNFSNDNLCDIWCRQYDPTGATYGFERQVSGNVRPARLPSVANGRNRFAFATVWEDSGSSGWQVKIRYNDLRNIFDYEKTVNNSVALPGKHEASVCLYHDYASVMFLDSSRAKCRGDIFEQAYELVPGTSQDSLSQYYFNFRMNQDDKIRANGRKGYYHFPNYDNPATATWNENPRLASAPDSIYIPLDSAYVQALLSRNITPATSFFKVADTDTFLAGRSQKGSINGKTYDACIMDMGYATSELSAGTIDHDQQDSLVKFTGSLLCSGNDFGEMYNATTLFTKFGAVYDGPGNASATGNIDSLMGQSATFTRGMTLHYPFQQAADNSVDQIHSASGATTILSSEGPGKIILARGTSYASSYKGGKAVIHNNVYLPFSMAVLSSDGAYPNTPTELTRRIMAFQKFNVEPAPITDLVADTGNALPEGSVVLNWTATYDQSLSDSCKKYSLKFRDYDPARIDSGRITSETAFTDSGDTYCQAWTPKNGASAESETLYGLPPADTLIFTLKAGDTSAVTRWSALGNEPRVKVKGDTLTPHSIGIGYPYGAVKDFIRQEQIDVRGGDTLYFTWDKNYAYVGYCGNDWRSNGDLFVYIDTRTAIGADSTIPDWNGSAADTASLFDTGGDFKPDYCFILDNNTGTFCRLKRWNSSAWVDTVGTYPDTLYCLDSLHHYSYTEVKLPFKWIGYSDTTKPFKFQVLTTNEGSEHTFNAFPPANNIGKSKAPPTRYGYYYLINGLTSNKKPGDNKIVSALDVELGEFIAMAGGSSVELRWSTGSETDNYAWLIERSTNPDGGFSRIATISAAGTGSSGHQYAYTDASLAPGMTYYYLLGDQDLGGGITWHGPVSALIPGVSIAGLSLNPATPNPARNSADIRFALPQSGLVSLAVYDICGRQVRILRDENMSAGLHLATWDGKDNDGRTVTAGVYFYRLSANGQHLTRKQILLK